MNITQMLEIADNYKKCSIEYSALHFDEKTIDIIYEFDKVVKGYCTTQRAMEVKLREMMEMLPGLIYGLDALKDHEKENPYVQRNLTEFIDKLEKWRDE